MNKSKIEWCDMTWNPVTGCLHGCEYCYARRIARRFSGCYDPASGENIKQEETGVVSLEHVGRVFYKTRQDKVITAPYPYGFAPTFHRYRLDEPQRIKTPQNIFVCSMADLFGEWVPDEWIREVFKACEAAPWHKYLFLTKNPDKYGEIQDLIAEGNWWNPDVEGLDMWWGATVTNEEQLYEAYSSMATWMSIEPLLEDISLSFNECSVEFADHDSSESRRWKWVVIGAETGNRKGKVVPEREWIESIVDDCRNWKTPVFMKNSLADIWGEPLIQEYPWEVTK